MSLKLSWATFEQAKFAVEHWHYSAAMPAGKLVKVGVWENEVFIGVVLFGRGANNHLLMPYGLDVTEGCELVRVALKAHEAPVTKIVSIALKMLKKNNPGLKLVVSFADSRQDHIGTIYQAGNWIYAGAVKSTPEFYYQGRWMHQRNMHSIFGTIKGNTLPTRDGGYRLRYLYPLDDRVKQDLLKIKRAYPKDLAFAKTKTA